MKLKSLALALAIFIAGVGEAMSGGVPYPSNINTLPTSGLTANHFLLGDTIQGLKDSGYSTVPCASGGTGLTSGTPGGIPYFSATCTLLSSVALSNHALIIGGLAGAGPHPMATLGTTSQVLIGGGLGDPTWGTPPAGPCAAATLSVLGCVFAPTTPTPAHQFLNGYNGTVWTSAQPDFADLTGTIGCGAIPALTGDITSTAGSCATTVAKIQGKVVAGTTGTGNVVFSNSPTLTGTMNIGGILASSQIKSNLAAGFAIDAAGGTARIYALQSAGLNRWGFVAANTPETGSGNTGSDMRINRYDDTGTFIDAPISALRSTGVVTIADGVVITGAGGACTNQFVKSISTSMVPTCATINLATDVTGTFGCAQMPAETGDVTSPAGSCVNTVAKIAGTTVGGTTGTGNVMFSASPTFTGTLTGASVLLSGAGGACTNQFVRSISTALIPTCASVSLATDVTGTLAPAAFGPLTGDVSTLGYAAVIQKIQGTAVGGTTGSGNVAFSASPTFTGTANFAAVVITGAGGACTNQFVRSISTGMIATCASVNLATDVTGTFNCTMRPAETGDVTSPAGSCATTLAAIQGTTVTGTTGTGSAVLSASPTVTGTLNITGNIIATSSIKSTTPFGFAIDTAAGNPRTYLFQTAGLNRWGLQAGSGAESTGNVGSDFLIRRYDDTGTAIDSPVTIGRSTGRMVVADGVTITGAGGTCTNQFVRSLSTGMIATCASVNLATDVTGTLPPADCPPAVSGGAIGCVFAPASPTPVHQFLTGYNGTTWSSAQPDVSDLTGVFSCAQRPAETGDVTSPAGSCATTVAKIQGTTVAGTTGSGNVAFSAAPTFTGTALAASMTASGTFKSTLTGLTVAGFAADGAAGTVRSYGIQTNGLLRWGLSANLNAESTGNVGSDFIISRFDDTGTGIDVPFKITRATGVVTIADGVLITGAGGTCANQFVRSISTGMVAACASVNLATDVTGTLPPAACPPSTGLALGCMFAPASPTPIHQFLTGYNGTIWQSAQPDVSDLTGVFSCAQRPAETGDVTSPAGSCATTLAKIQGTTVTGTTGTGSAVLSASPTLTGTALANNLTASGQIKSNLPTGFVIDAAAGTSRAYLLQSSSLSRWGFVAANTAESTGNVGSDMRINRYDDSGAFIDAPISALRSTGKVTIADGITITGAGVTCTNQFVRTIPTSMIGTCASVNLASDVTGALPSGSFGPLTGDVTTVGYAATVAKIGGTTVGGSTGTGNVAFSAAPTFTGTANFAGVVITGAGATCTNQFVRSISTAMVGTCSSVNLASDVTGLLPSASCPPSTGLALGCMFAPATPTPVHQFVKGYNGTIWQTAQPDFTDLTGSIACAQEPAWTGDITSPAGSCATSVAAIQGTVVTGTTGTGKVAFDTAPSFNGAASFVDLNATGNIRSSSLAPAAIGVDAAAGTQRSMGFFSSGSMRWAFRVTNTAESGANVGSDILFRRFDDTGTAIDNPMQITRSTGVVAFADGLSVAAGGVNIVTGGLNVGSGGVVNSSFITPQEAISFATPINRSIAFQTNLIDRWQIRANGSTESGANVGTDFSIRRYDDAGVFLDAPISVVRSTGVVTFADPVVLTGAGATCANAFVRTIATSMIGTCSAVNLALDVTGLLPFTSLSGVPTTVAGYGITDALKTTNNLSDLTNAQTAKTNLGINRLFTTSDFTKVNTTSLNVPGLAITGVAGKTYSIRAAIHLTVDAVSGFRIRMGGTSTASFDIYQVNAVCDTTGAMIAAQRITDWATTNLNYTGGCTSVFVTFDGTVNISANGTIVPQFATGTGVVTATLLQGSFIEYNLLN